MVVLVLLGQLQSVLLQARGAQLRCFDLLGHTIGGDTSCIDWSMVCLA